MQWRESSAEIRARDRRSSLTFARGRRVRASGSHRRVAAGDGRDRGGGRSAFLLTKTDGVDLGPSHAVSKLYYLAWNEAAWAAYQSVFKKLVSTVDGVERQATPWPDWALTTVIDTRAWWPVVSARGRMPRVPGRRVRRAAETRPVAVRGVLGIAVVLSRVQPRQRRARSVESDLFDGIDDSTRVDRQHYRS